MAVLDSLLEKILSSRNLQSGKRHSPTRKQPRRLGIERMEPRTLLASQSSSIETHGDFPCDTRFARQSGTASVIGEVSARAGCRV